MFERLGMVNGERKEVKEVWENFCVGRVCGIWFGDV